MPALLRLVRPAVAALALGWLGRILAEDALPRGSPFFSASAPGPAVAPGETIEFAAVRTIGKQTDINLYDTQVKKSHWIPLGGTADGMSVLNYDARREQVVAKIGGVEKVLMLRKARGVANAPAPVFTAAPAESFAMPANSFGQKSQPPPPSAAPADATASAPPATVAPTTPAPTPAQPAAPLSIARQEEEARMLVSDLLEIGMAQRKAYEEKQRQAIDPNAASATPSPAPASTAPGGPPGS